MKFFLQALFLNVLHMSITASYVILFVIVARTLMKRIPKVFSYALWIVVLFRLICPFSFSSTFSFLKPVASISDKMKYTAFDIEGIGNPHIVVGAQGISPTINPSLTTTVPYTSADSMQRVLFIFSVIWILGVIMLVGYSIASYLTLKHQVHLSIRLQDNIFECESISTPFVLGMINPKIYLPIGLWETEKSYIIKHEQIHVRRFDYILKPFAFLILCVHWFNPLAWISFILASRDMEMSCDEQVIKELGTGIKKDYSTSLLSLAVHKKLISGNPLAFGETDAKQRIKNVLNYKHPALWVVVVAIIAVAVITMGLMTNPNSPISHTEKTRMAENWAEALKIRDGKLRYEIMSEEMKQKFISEQKQRSGSEEWYYNIGSSSPWVEGYEIDIQKDTATILYHLTDSSAEKYTKTEVITFGKENNQMVIVDAKEELSPWERVSYFASTAEQAMKVYTQALLESDYLTLLSLTHAEPFDPNGQEIWDTIKIDRVKVISADVRENKACYALELDIRDGGNSAFETGIFPRWLWLVKSEQGWYVQGLMTGGVPDEDWWISN